MENQNNAILEKIVIPQDSQSAESKNLLTTFFKHPNSLKWIDWLI